MFLLSFKPKAVTKNLVSGLNERAKDIILKRYGLGDSSDKKTLEAIGKNYGITRERVRQLENYALDSIRQSQDFSSYKNIFSEINNFITKNGEMLSENEILEKLADDQISKNHIHFLLVIGDEFIKLKEDDSFGHRWTVNKEKAEKIHNILNRLHKEISNKKLIAENEIISILQDYSREELNEKVKEETILSWLKLSKLIDRNVLGEWGSVDSEYIRPRGVRDLAFLILKKDGSPMHFNQVADSISNLFSRKAHSATVHNEVIKDDRFVLVGRGMYALKEWGYTPGTVKDIVKTILKSNGALSKEEIIKNVLRERYVKENTILVNLQNKKFFKRNSDGTYKIV